MNGNGVRARNQAIGKAKKKKTSIMTGRRDVIGDLYFNQHVDTVKIRDMLLREKDSDWTTNEIINHMNDLGIPLKGAKHYGVT